MTTVAAATINSVTYDGSSIVVQWSPANDPSVTGYQIQVTSADYGVILQSAVIPGSAAAYGSLVVHGALNLNIVFTVQVVSQTAGGAGESSPSVPLLTALPEIKAIVYDGSNLDFEWAIPDSPAGGFQLLVVSQDSGMSFSATVPDPLARSGRIPQGTLPTGGLDPEQSWTVQIAAQGINGVYAATPAGLALPAGLPSLQIDSAQYVGDRRVDLIWGAVEGGWVAGYAIKAWSPQGGLVYSIDIPAQFTSGTLPIVPALPPEQTYQVRLLALNANGVGIATPSLPLLHPPGQIVGTVYDGATVALSWLPSTDSTVTSYTAQVEALSSGHSWTGAASESGGSVATGAITPSQGCVARAVAKCVGSADAVSVDAPILAALPVVTSVRYDGDTLVVGWSPAAASGIVAVTVSHLVDGAVAQSRTLHDSGATSVTFRLSQPLQTTQTHTVQVTALAEAGASSVSAPVTVPTRRPELLSARYDGKQVVAGWGTGLTGATGFTLEVIAPGATYQVAVGGTATTATLALPGLLGDGGDSRLVLSAQLPGGVTVAIPPLPLVTVLPVVLDAVYDGRSLAVEWQPQDDAAATLTGWTATLSSTGSSVSYPASSTDPLCDGLTIGGLPVGGLDTTLTWVLTVAALGENGISAQTQPLAVVAPRPVLGHSSYQDGRIAANWSALSDPSGHLSGYDLSVAGTGLDLPEELGVAGATATSAVLRLDQPLLEDGTYALTLAAVSRDGVRTLGDPVSINSGLPSDLRLVYDGAQVALTWTLVPTAGATGQKLTVIGAQSGQTYSQTIADTQTRSGTVAIPSPGLDEAQPWQARVWVTGGVDGGSRALPVLVSRPKIASVLYDGDSVTLGWTPVLDPRVTGYRVTLVPVTGTTIRLDVEGGLASSAVLALVAPLSSAGANTVTVTALAGPIASLSDPVVLDVAQPQVSSILYAGGQISVGWSASTNPDVTGYVVAVTGQWGRSFTQPVSGGTATSGVVSVGGALGTDQGWRVSVRTVTAAAVSAASTPTGLIAEIPALTALSYDGTALDAAWTASPDPIFGLAGFQLAVRPASSSTPDHHTAIDDPLARSGRLAVSGLDGNHVAEIRAVTASGAVTVSAPVPVIVTSPAGLEVFYRAGTVCASWTPLAGASGYRAELTDAGGTVLARETVSGSSLRLTGPLDPDVAVSLRVAQVDGISAGPVSNPVPVLVGSGDIASVQTEGLAVTVGLTPPSVTTGITSYLVRLYEDGVHQDSKTSTDGTPVTFTLTSAEAGRRYMTTVQPQGTSTHGPESASAPVLTVAPAGLDARLDGPVLVARWPAFSDPRLTGYVVALSQGTTSIATVPAEETEVRVPVSLPTGASGRFSATFRARAGVAVGPASAAIPVWGQGYQYFQQPAQATVVPYLFRSQSATPPASPASTITLYLPQIFTTTPTLPITHGSFSLTAATAGSAYPYMISFAADNPVWTFGIESIRDTLRRDFDAFLIAVEAAGTTAFGLGLLRQVLALGLPLTYAETLYYRYGFDPSHRTCDLNPGMDLVLDGQMFQYEGTSASAVSLSGFVPGGGRDFSIGSFLDSAGVRFTGFEAFLSALTGLSVPTNNKGSGGVADLYAAGFRRPYWRVLYPAGLNGGDSTGSYSLNNNVAILGCNSFADLEAATTVYLATGNFSTATVDYAATFFRGRMLALPHVRVSLNGQLRSVPVGTTVRQLTQGIGLLPAASGTAFSGIDLTRRTGSLVNCVLGDVQQRVDEVNPIALAANAFTIQAPQADILDLPVLGGDSLTVR